MRGLATEYGIHSVRNTIGSFTMAESISLYPQPTIHQVNAQAAVRDYRLNPTVDYSSVVAVKGPLIILENVKVHTRAHAYIVYSSVDFAHGTCTDKRAHTSPL